MNRDITKSTTDVAEGSIYGVSNTKGVKPEEVLAEADVVVMLDVSSSMSAQLSSGVSRFDRAKESLTDLQRSFPGRIVLLTFNDITQIELSGLPRPPSGMTNILKALEKAFEFDGMDTHFYMISDGAPNVNPEHVSLEFAKKFKDPIHCIFIGDDNDEEGIEFMKKLAEATGGTNSGKIEPHLLGQKLKLLISREG